MSANTNISGTITDPRLVRSIAKDQSFRSEQLYVSKPNGHLFKIGDKLVLTGLTDYPEFNGDAVTIVNIREDGPHGRSYYVSGAINSMLNWVYEYRLKLIDDTEPAIDWHATALEAERKLREAHDAMICALDWLRLGAPGKAVVVLEANLK
jgi:hypothetical protein